MTAAGGPVGYNHERWKFRGNPDGMTMVCKGRVENGVIVIEGHVQLPEGSEVRIETVSPAPAPTLYDRFRDVIGKAVDLPDDLAEQHDHYLYGVPKS